MCHPLITLVMLSLLLLVHSQPAAHGQIEKLLKKPGTLKSGALQQSKAKILALRDSWRCKTQLNMENVYEK